VAGIVLAMAGAVALAAAGLVDQLGPSALGDHAAARYAAHGMDVSAGLLYGLVYTVAALDALLWLLVLRSALAGRRRAAVYAGVVVLVGAGLAATLLGSQEYGETIFPRLWGALALLSPVAGVVALVQLGRR
jgi:hypothetical protein